MRQLFIVGALAASLAVLAGCGKEGGSSSVAEKPADTAAHAASAAHAPAAATTAAAAHTAEHAASAAHAATAAATAAAGAASAAASAGPGAPGASMEAPAIPAGNSKVPTSAEWESAAAVNTVGANAAAKDCSMKMVREWLKVHCTGKIKEVTNVEGLGVKGTDYFDSVIPGSVADYVVRVKKGNPIKMRILREGGAGASLFVNWPTNLDKPSIIALQTYAG